MTRKKHQSTLFAAPSAVVVFPSSTNAHAQKARLQAVFPTRTPAVVCHGRLQTFASFSVLAFFGSILQQGVAGGRGQALTCMHMHQLFKCCQAPLVDQICGLHMKYNLMVKGQVLKLSNPDTIVIEPSPLSAAPRPLPRSLACPHQFDAAAASSFNVMNGSASLRRVN